MMMVRKQADFPVLKNCAQAQCDSCEAAEIFCEEFQQQLHNSEQDEDVGSSPAEGYLCFFLRSGWLPTWSTDGTGCCAWAATGSGSCGPDSGRWYLCCAVVVRPTWTVTGLVSVLVSAEVPSRAP
ncbi:uncharacterized protein LOC132195927 [Neocloeon triangulifer]|uniref:uncharacterized protein LOC132195927 n=1 Tax=Neocloeon triangulifer TaxID=2078957 RepID=UPI00286F96C8|nr:uncharacterized protein LOC132195927 [Neocloeon triangulifer]